MANPNNLNYGRGFTGDTSSAWTTMEKTLGAKTNQATETAAAAEAEKKDSLDGLRQFVLHLNTNGADLLKKLEAVMAEEKAKAESAPVGSEEAPAAGAVAPVEEKALAAPVQGISPEVAGEMPEKSQVAEEVEVSRGPSFQEVRDLAVKDEPRRKDFTQLSQMDWEEADAVEPAPKLDRTKLNEIDWDNEAEIEKTEQYRRAEQARKAAEGLAEIEAIERENEAYGDVLAGRKYERVRKTTEKVGKRRGFRVFVRGLLQKIVKPAEEETTERKPMVKIDGEPVEAEVVERKELPPFEEAMRGLDEERKADQARREAQAHSEALRQREQATAATMDKAMESIRPLTDEEKAEANEQQYRYDGYLALQALRTAGFKGEADAAGLEELQQVKQNIQDSLDEAVRKGDEISRERYAELAQQAVQAEAWLRRELAGQAA